MLRAFPQLSGVKRAGRASCRPVLAGLAVVGLSLGVTACSDDDGNEDDIDNPLDGVDDQIDDGAENLEEEIDSETDDGWIGRSASGGAAGEHRLVR